MPSLSPTLLQAAFYLFGINPKKTDQIVGPFGTGFIVARELKIAAPLEHYYAVTNWHVAIGGGASIIRLNTRDGKTQLIEFDPAEWQYDPDIGDLAAIDITTHIDPNRDEVACFTEAAFVTEQFIVDYKLRLGTDLFMVGLFASHGGGSRNVPAVRFGNLSMLATPYAPVEQPHGRKLPSHLGIWGI